MCGLSASKKFDVLAAQNFSFWLFKTREGVRDYFQHAHANLADEGIIVIDMMGGGQCFEEGHTDVKKIKNGKKGFKYLWHQSRFNPITNDAIFHISFLFKDGSRLDRAFVYNWRFWSIPEVTELLREAGFSDALIYWEDSNEDGEDLGTWSRHTVAESQPSWIAYIIGIK